MEIYDWIVVGGGIAGSSVGYELANAGFSVLLLQNAMPASATRYSYGGIAYWSGTTPLIRQLCQEAIDLHRNLSAELDSDTQFRELDLLLTITADRDPEAIAALYQDVALPPRLISAADAVALEPMLNRGAIAAALQGRHGHVSPDRMVQSYQQAMIRLGGKIQFGQVIKLISDKRDQHQRIAGVVTTEQTYLAANVIIAAGAMSRALLKLANIPVRLYFTQAELLETPPLDLHLSTLVMPAELKRFQMEAEAGRGETDALWDQTDHEITPPVLDAGVVQFQDGSLRIGQISRTLTDPAAQVDAAHSEAELRAGIGQILPALKDVPGQWCSCLVSFSGDRLPLVGALPDTEGVYIFAGFSNPFALMPPLARRFAHSMTGQEDAIVAQLAPSRFIQSAIAP
jgi:glycine/D-amino acid oxidase-like deaminating enzyme